MGLVKEPLFKLKLQPICQKKKKLKSEQRKIW